MAKNKTQPKKVAELAQQTEVRIVLNEAGTSGLKEQQGFVYEAYHTQLYWPGVQPTYHRLRTSMPEIVAIRQAFTAWARKISPVVEMPDDPTDDDKKYQEFVLSDFENMEGGFGRLIDDMVNNVPFNGWGWWEAVPSRRLVDWKPPDAYDEWRSEEDDGLIGIRRMAWRDPSTFAGWDFTPNKRLRGMIQTDYPHDRITLPLKNSLHITYGGGNSPEGNTPMQAVWRLERIKYGLEVIQGIGFEHSAGYLDVKKIEKGDLSADAKGLVRDAARAILSAQEGNYALWPYGIEGSVKDINFQAAGTILEAIKYYGILTLSVYVMQWIALNTMTGTGSFASADNSTDMSVSVYNGMMDGFAQQYDDQIGRRLYQWNKASFPNMTKRPKIKFSHIEKNIAIETLGNFFRAIDGVIPLGEEDYKAFRLRSEFLPKDLPEIDLTIDRTQPAPPEVNSDGTPVVDPADKDQQPPVNGKKTATPTAPKKKVVQEQAVSVRVMAELTKEIRRGNDILEKNSQ
jgi:hypothetical protein